MAVRDRILPEDDDLVEEDGTRDDSRVTEDS